MKTVCWKVITEMKYSRLGGLDMCYEYPQDRFPGWLSDEPAGEKETRPTQDNRTEL